MTHKEAVGKAFWHLAKLAFERGLYVEFDRLARLAHTYMKHEVQ